MFFDAELFPITAILESKWQIIRQEFEQLAPHQLMPWPEKDIYDRSWDVFGLWAVGKRLDANCRFCPETAAILDAIQGITMAGFSQLAPGARIRPHIGYTDTVLRCHLGLIVPDNCGIQVGDERRTWREGKCLVFDDTALHSAWNDSEQPRIVLIVDFLRAGKTFDATMSKEAAKAVQDVLSKSEFDADNRT